jgi:hypothetical protein
MNILIKMLEKNSLKFILKKKQKVIYLFFYSVYLIYLVYLIFKLII